LVLGIVTIIFFVVHAARGDPTTTLIRPGLTPEVAAQMRANYGLDEPIPIRYAKWLGSMLTGDFGQSSSHGRPTLDVVMEVLPNTLLLSACALFVAFLFGVVLGTIQAVRQYSALDSTLSVVLLFFYSMPSFWLAMMLSLSLSWRKSA
jgi:peptide/nickel transport system permease protein